MDLVTTVTVGAGGAAAIEFTGIAGTGKDIVIVLSSRSTGGDGVDVQLNGSSAGLDRKSVV